MIAVIKTGVIEKWNDISTDILEIAIVIITNNLEVIIPKPTPKTNATNPKNIVSIAYNLPIFWLVSPINT